MDIAGAIEHMQGVALRKESVDRNTIDAIQNTEIDTSLSARRAWIEMMTAADKTKLDGSRSPQGERG